MTVVNSTVCGNNAGWSGGGVYNAGWSGTASLTLENSTITGNQAGSGGGVYNAGYGGTASLTVNNCAIIGNQALTIGGGGLYNGVSGGSAVLMLANSTVSGNLAATGGGIYNGDDYVLRAPFCPSNASLQILNSTFSTYWLKPFTSQLPRQFDNPAIPNAPGGDGTDIGAFEIQTADLNPAQAVRHLLALVNSQAKRLRPLCATLDAALASIGRNNPTAAINQLAAFQKQVRAQVMPSDQALAATLLQSAQDAINALNAKHCVRYFQHF